VRLAGAAVALKKIATGASSGSVSTGALSQVRSVRSSEAETARRPSGVTATAQTYGLRVCGSSGRRPSLRVAAFGQSWADTAWRPSGVSATALMGLVWLLSVRSVSPVPKSQSR
jgi:hypothetical protein